MYNRNNSLLHHLFYRRMFQWDFILLLGLILCATNFTTGYYTVSFLDQCYFWGFVIVMKYHTIFMYSSWFREFSDHIKAALVCDNFLTIYQDQLAQEQMKCFEGFYKQAHNYNYFKVNYNGVSIYLFVTRNYFSQAVYLNVFCNLQQIIEHRKKLRYLKQKSMGFIHELLGFDASDIRIDKLTDIHSSKELSFKDFYAIKKVPLGQLSYLNQDYVNAIPKEIQRICYEFETVLGKIARIKEPKSNHPKFYIPIKTLSFSKKMSDLGIKALLYHRSSR